MIVQCKDCMVGVSKPLKVADTQYPEYWVLGTSYRCTSQGKIYICDKELPWGGGRGTLLMCPDDSINVTFDRRSRGCCAYGNVALFCFNGHRVGLVCIDCYEYYIAFDANRVITSEQSSCSRALTWL